MQATKQTPLTKLLADKEHIRKQCQQQEQKLNENMSYIHENASSLLFSGVSSLLFPGSKSSKKTNTVSSENMLVAESSPTTPLGVSDYLSVGKSLLPVIWEIAQPFVITWGIKRVKNLVGLAFTKKNKKT